MRRIREIHWCAYGLSRSQSSPTCLTINIGGSTWDQRSIIVQKEEREQVRKKKRNRVASRRGRSDEDQQKGARKGRRT